MPHANTILNIALTIVTICAGHLMSPDDISFITKRVYFCESSHKLHVISSTSSISTLFGCCEFVVCRIWFVGVAVNAFDVVNAAACATECCGNDDDNDDNDGDGDDDVLDNIWDDFPIVVWLLSSVKCASLLTLLLVVFLLVLFSFDWPVVKRHSHNNEQLQTSGLFAKYSRWRRSNGKWAASNVRRSLPRMDISTKCGLPWNNFNGRSVYDGFSSSVITCRNVLSTKALFGREKKRDK